MRTCHIIWDFDGTIVDTYPNIAKAFVSVCRDRFGTTVEYEDAYSLAKVSLRVSYEELAAACETTPEEMRIAFTERYRERTIGVGEPVFNGVVEVMRLVKSSGGMNLLVTHRERQSLDRYGSFGGGRELLTDIVAGGEGFPDKPDPAAFTHLMAKHDLARRDTVGVGDRALDVGAARAAGISACYFDPEGLSLTDADYHFRDYTELLAWVRDR